MIQSAFTRTAGLVGGRHILAIQDTTCLRSDGDQYSIQAHPTIGVDAQSGALLGLVHADILVREGGMKEQRRHRAFEDKESRRWLDGARAAAGLLEHSACHVTVVADRESDIYESFCQRPEGVDMVVRSGHNRRLETGSCLFEHLSTAPQAGQFDLDIAAKPGQSARRAKLAVRFCPVDLLRPKSRGKSDLPDKVELYAVELIEIEAPKGTKPIHWRLLTSHVVDSFDKARWISHLYRQRWIIEEVFRTLKTRGFDIERVSIAQEPFEKLAIVALLAAISVMQLVKARDGTTSRPLNDVFQLHEQEGLETLSKSLEGKTQKQKNPHPRGSLAYAAWVCARLGGWTGYYGKPGPIVMLKGMHRLRAIQKGWAILENV